MKFCGLAILLAICSLSLAGCSLLPAEETLPQAPVINAYQGEDFTLCYVQRGDLVQTESFNVSYSAVRVEKLSFPVSGILFKDVYVRVGDTVQAGQLLAELDQSNLSEQLRSLEDQAEQLRLSIQQTETSRDLALEEQRIRLSFIEDEEELENAATLEDIERPYAASLTELHDRLRIVNMQLDALEEQRAQRRLVAGIDGTVSYLRSLKDTDLSVEGEHILTISDSSSSMFLLKTEELELFEPGMELKVSMGQDEIPVAVVDPSTLEGVTPEEDTVYLLPTDAAALALEDGDRGTLSLELARQPDCLYINAKAVKSMGNEHFVYYQDENGLRSMKTVVTGFEADGYIQILEGLEQGEAVILR